MIKPLLHPDEEERLKALQRYEILDTDPEQDFDDLTALASHICGAEIATMSLVDVDRQWFKSKVGWTECGSSRDVSFCAHGLLQSDWFEVGDTLKDERFADNPMVTGDPNVRFYAGSPLVTPDGHALGMLCVIDRYPREISAAQKAALQALSRQVVAQLELRSSVKKMKRSLAEQEAAEGLLRESENKFRELAAHVSDMFWIASPDLRQIHYASPAYEPIWGRTLQSLYEYPETVIEAVVPGDRGRVQDAFARLASGDAGVSMEFQIVRPDGEVRWVLNRGFQIHDAEGRVVRITGLATDITERKLAEAELQKTHKVLVEASRRAGMAEVATTVLHNVGNVLNSVNVSASCVSDNLKKSKVASLSKVVKLLGQHEGDLSHFLTNDSQGRQLPPYLAQLAAHLAGEQQSAIKELGHLQKNIEHIKDIVSMQQSLARVFGLVESLQVADLVEDALKMNADSMTRHGVQVIRDFEEVPNVTVEKHKVLQILVNLFTNARQACDELDPPEKRLTVRIASRGRNVRVAVVDNGIGIPRQNLTRVFAYGFTTKESGHGFGLHSGALAAKELGGSLEAVSDGPGLGATFVLELPWDGAKS